MSGVESALAKLIRNKTARPEWLMIEILAAVNDFSIGKTVETMNEI